MDKQKTVWEAFMEFVNSKENGSIITRQEIIQYLDRKGLKPYSSDGAFITVPPSYECYSVHTLDYIRNLSEKVGYLDKTRHAGMYVVNKHFPSGYTVSQLRKDYDSRTW
jgi:hypothetical protein